MALHDYTRRFILPAPPDADNDETEGYEVGDVVFVTGGSIYDCRDASAGAAVWEERGSGSGVTDHGALTGLADDDHPQYIKHSLATAVDDFLVASGAGVFVKKTLAQTVTILRTVLDAVYSATGHSHSGLVTGGDSHDHVGGDGAQIDHGGLAGLADDDHTQYVRHNLSTASNDFLMGSGSNTWIKQTLAQAVTAIRTVLDSIYAPTAKGVTNGDSHDHTGGDGAALKYSIPLGGHGLNGTIASGGTIVFTPFFFYGLNAASYNFQVKRSGTIRNLSIKLNSAQPNSGGVASLIVTVMVNNVASSLAKLISANSAAGDYTETTTDVNVSAGDLLIVRFQNNASSASAQIGAVSLEYEMSVYP
jgi:hypothetical protein